MEPKQSPSPGSFAGLVNREEVIAKPRIRITGLMETDDSKVLSLLKLQLNRIAAEIQELQADVQRHERLVAERAALLKWIEAVERGLV